MTNCKALFFLANVLIALNFCKQTSHPVEKGSYSIDSSIRKKINKSVQSPEEAARSSVPGNGRFW